MGFLGADHIPAAVLRGLSADDRRWLEDDDEPLTPRFALLRRIMLRNLVTRGRRRGYTKPALQAIVKWQADLIFTNGPLLDAQDARERLTAAQRRKGTKQTAQKAHEKNAPIVRDIDAQEGRQQSLTKAIRQYLKGNCTDEWSRATRNQRDNLIKNTRQSYYREKRRTAKKRL